MKKNSIQNEELSVWKWLTISLSLAIFFSASYFAFSEIFPADAAVNQTITFQGKVVNKIDGTNISSGNPSCVVGGASNDTCDFRVSIYSDPSAGTQLWYEVQSDVEIGDSEGVIAMNIGSQCIDTLGGTWTVDGDGAGTVCGVAGGGVDWSSDPTLYLQIEWDTDGNGDFTGAEVFSRKLLTTVPTAFRAESADVADTAGGLSGSGDVTVTADGDVDDYIYFDTTTNSPGLYWAGVLAYTNAPGIRVNASTGQLEYRDQDEGTWTAFDSAGGGGGSSFYTASGVVANGAYIEVIHGQNTNDVLSQGWIYDSDSAEWKDINSGIVSSAAEFGDGSDGTLTVSTSLNMNTTDSSATTDGNGLYADGIAYKLNMGVAFGADNVTTVDTPSGISVGDEVLLINLQGASGDTADVGNYEVLEVDGIAANTVTFTTNIQNSYDGTTPSNQKVVIQRVPEYSSLTVQNGGTVTASAWDGLATAPTGYAGYYTGIVAFKNSGSTEILSGGSITVAELGYDGGIGTTLAENMADQGESYTGLGTNLNTANAGGGGGGGRDGSEVNYGGAGGGAGYGTVGAAGASDGDGYADEGDGGATYGGATLSSLFLGSGGGGSKGSGTGATGGKGGGILYMSARGISNTGTISADAQAGDISAVGDGNRWGSGGGSGGSILLKVDTVTLGSSSSSGGTGGSSAGTGGAGGDGGVGRVRIEYTGSISGSSTPAASTTTFVPTQSLLNDEFLIKQIDSNTVRLYNYSGISQTLRLDVITGGGGGGSTDVSFSAHRNGVNQSIPTGVDTKVELTTEEFDTNNNFDNATNYRFQPTVAGKYVLNATATFTAGADGYVYTCIIYKNGATYKKKGDFASSAAAPTCDVTAVVEANGSTDYFEMYVSHGTGSSKNVSGGSAQTFFTGSLVSGAGGGGTGYWNLGTEGLYFDTDSVIVGSDSAFQWVGTPASGDLKVQDAFEAGGAAYVGDALTVGAGLDTSAADIVLTLGGVGSETIKWNSTSAGFTLSDDLLPDTGGLYDLGSSALSWQRGYFSNISATGDVGVQPDGDVDDYIYFDTTTNTPGLYWSGVLTYTNDPGVRANSSTGQLEYRDQDSATWVSFDSLSGGGIGALDCSILSGGDWIKVPGNSSYGDGSDFCVMKYEVRENSSTKKVESVAAGTPVANRTLYDAGAACTDLGAHLITNDERMTIARDIEGTTINDMDDDALIQFATGHSDGTPFNPIAGLAGADPVVSGCNLSVTMENAANAYVASSCEIRGDGSYGADANDKGYYGTGQAWSATGYSPVSANKSQLRTYVLSNGEVIWDFSGNDWEFVDYTKSTTNWWNSSGLFYGWTDANITDWEIYIAGPADNSNQGLGTYRSNGTSEIMTQGGGFRNDFIPGLYSVHWWPNTYQYPFRCVYGQDELIRDSL